MGCNPPPGLLVQLGVDSLCKAIEGNFLDMPFESDSFDGAYAIEATCHSAKVSAIPPRLLPVPCLASMIKQKDPQQ
jgi:hypothetical protein